MTVEEVYYLGKIMIELYFTCCWGAGKCPDLAGVWGEGVETLSPAG